MSVSKLKKISVIFLTLIITALMMCSVSAEDGTSCSANCNGTYKNGFCSTGNMSHVEPATQNQHGVYQIENGGQLFWFASQVNSGKSSLNAELTCDIDLEGINWTPIGKSTSAFYTGEFNGNGYVISNLCIDTTNIDNAGNIGLFGYVKGGIINDFTVQGEISVKSGEGIGGAVGYANYYKRSAVISNIISKVNISGVENCKSVGGVVGGLFDANDNVDYVYNCVNYGNISLGTSYDGIGGIVGYAYAGDSIVNCVNYGNMSAAGISDITPCMGGILGYQRHTMVNFKGNLNLGIITDTSGQNSRTGAIAGWFRNNGSNATVSSDNYALEGTAQFLQGMHNEMKELTASFVTMEQLSNGEVAYWLSQSNVENQPSWGQNIGTDQYPQLGGKKVYRGYDKCKAIYSNSTT